MSSAVACTGLGGQLAVRRDDQRRDGMLWQDLVRAPAIALLAAAACVVTCMTLKFDLQHGDRGYALPPTAFDIHDDAATHS